MAKKLFTAYVAATVMAFCTVANVYAGDGTLPLRRAGDGTLPVMVGSANALPGGAAVRTELRFTSIDVNELAGPAAQRLNCRVAPSVSKHTASGSLTIGAQSYAVHGICYDHTTSVMDVLASSAVLSGGITPNAELQRFEGRLSVNGPPAAAGRYVFSLAVPPRS